MAADLPPPNERPGHPARPGRGAQPGDGAQPEHEPDHEPRPAPEAEPARRPDRAAPAGRKPKPGRRVSVAVGVGLCLGGAVLLSLYVIRWFFLVILILFLGIAVGELTRALAARGVRVPVPPVALGLLAMVVSAWGAGPENGPEGLIAAFGFTSLAVMVWRLPAGVHGYVRDMTAGVFAAAYVPFLAGFAVLMLIPPDGANRIVAFIAVTIASDIGGFFVGSLIGKHKMAPAISPKKTWEGFAGSAAACMLIGGLLLPLLLDGQWWQGVVLGAVATGSATFGDLVVSMIKRDLGIKDMGGLIPEHGGVMDRLDSLLATAPVAWLLLGLFIGF